MSHFDYKVAEQIATSDPPFYSLIMAAVLRADTPNLAILRRAYPETVNEVMDRYDAPGGIISERD